jgi:hypothetical protein
MEKLLKLINEYEESRWETIDDWLTEEERENWAIIEETPTRKEYEWHLRHCNANTVAFEKDTFDAYALSKKYGFIRWLVKNDKIDRERINDRWWDMSIHFTDEVLFIMS